MTRKKSGLPTVLTTTRTSSTRRLRRLSTRKAFDFAPSRGWLTCSIDGRLIYPSSGEVIDIASRKVIATLEDEKGATSKPKSSCKSTLPAVVRSAPATSSALVKYDSLSSNFA